MLKRAGSVLHDLLPALSQIDSILLVGSQQLVDSLAMLVPQIDRLRVPDTSWEASPRMATGIPLASPLAATGRLAGPGLPALLAPVAPSLPLTRSDSPDLDSLVSAQLNFRC